MNQCSFFLLTLEYFRIFSFEFQLCELTLIHCTSSTLNQTKQIKLQCDYLSDEDFPVCFSPDSSYLETVYPARCKNLERRSIKPNFVICQVITTLVIFSRELPTQSSGQSRTHECFFFFCGVFDQSNILICSFHFAARRPIAGQRIWHLHCDSN